MSRVFYMWSNGDCHEGYFKNGKRDGKGVMVWADGTRYKGEWKNGKRDGKGVMIRAKQSLEFFR